MTLHIILSLLGLIGWLYTNISCWIFVLCLILHDVVSSIIDVSLSFNLGRLLSFNDILTSFSGKDILHFVLLSYVIYPIYTKP